MTVAAKPMKRPPSGVLKRPFMPRTISAIALRRKTRKAPACASDCDRFSKPPPFPGGWRGGTTMATLPFDDRPGVIWYNGEFVPWKEATLHVLSHGLHYASAVFEGERAYGGVVFKLDDHTRRLHESGHLLGFEIPYSVEAI